MGWVREDLLSFRGDDCVALGLLTPGLYPAPFAPGEYWWIRGFTGPQPDHPGWDLGELQSEPVLAGAAGVVLTSFQAAKVTAERPRTIDHGLTLGDPRVFSDPGWGFGYGHYVIVRYASELLPEATRRVLAERGMAGAGVAVMYAHLHARSVEAGAMLAAGQTIGLCGTTGNSEAPHLHLEVRAIRNPAETSWARMRDGLIEPGVLFNR
jgi:murein DD-endopeptidase MepM/ murein hydrolase activator NlpD